MGGFLGLFLGLSAFSAVQFLDQGKRQWIQHRKNRRALKKATKLQIIIHEANRLGQKQEEETTSLAINAE